MDLVNRSTCAAHLFRGALDDIQIHATMVARAGYDVTETGRCVLAAAPSPIRFEDADVDGVPIDGDWAPVKRGVDVVVLGNAYPRPAPAERFTVTVRVGATERRIVAVGDRAWQPTPGVDFVRCAERATAGDFDPTALTPTDPVVFSAMPMTWTRAFGGKAPFGGGAVPYAQNPDGRGFLMLLDGAPGTQLPNWEDPAAPIATWRDWPQPTCLSPCPRTSKIRTDRGIEMRSGEDAFSVNPSYFSMAHPFLVIPDLIGDTDIEIEGMHPAGTFRCRLPVPHLVGRVDVGKRTLSLILSLDTVEVYPEIRRIAVVLRRSFRYYVHPGERRQVLLSEGGSS